MVRAPESKIAPWPRRRFFPPLDLQGAGFGIDDVAILSTAFFLTPLHGSVFHPSRTWRQRVGRSGFIALEQVPFSVCHGFGPLNPSHDDLRHSSSSSKTFLSRPVVPRLWGQTSYSHPLPRVSLQEVPTSIHSTFFLPSGPVKVLSPPRG